MSIELQNKIKEYKERFIPSPDNVVETGGWGADGCARHIFSDARDFCRIDLHRGVGVDIVADYHEADKLFDFNPDVVICLSLLAPDKRPGATIKAARAMLMPGGYMIACCPLKDGGSYLDVLLLGYLVLDTSYLSFEGNSTICGIAKKPYTIKHDPKTNS
jgi:hypothetical protein